MELSIKKNIKVAVYVNNQRLIDLDNSSVYSKVDGDDVYLLIKDTPSGQSVKLVIKEYAEEVENEDI